MELTLKEALKLGNKAHQAAEIQEADKYYTSILELYPQRPDANHSTGILGLGLGVGKLEDVIPIFKVAILANSSI